jgi:chromosome segregation ATPase
LLAAEGYNKAFKERVKELERALDAMRDRAEVLRDAAISATQQSSQEAEKMLRRVRSTGEAVMKKTDSTRKVMRNIHKQTEGLRLGIDRNEVHLQSVANSINSFDKQHRAYEDQFANVRNAQEQTNGHIQTLQDLDYVRALADDAIRLALAGADCKTNEVNIKVMY